MHRCNVCHFETVMDDVAVESSGGLVVCLVCYGNLTGTRLALSKQMRRGLDACLSDISTDGSAPSQAPLP
jgi:hypothetical protein